MFSIVSAHKRLFAGLGAVVLGASLLLASNASADEASTASAVQVNLNNIKSAYAKGDKDALDKAITSLQKNLDQAIDARSAEATASTGSPAMTEVPAAIDNDGGSTANQGNVVTVNGNDNGAVTAAIASAQSGGTVVFPAGSYSVGRVTLKGGVLYKADGNVTLKASEETIFACNDDCDGTTIDGFTFDGGNLNIGRDGGVTKNVKIVNNTVKNVHSNDFAQSAGLFLNKLDGSTVSNNTITDINGSEDSNGMRIYNPNRTTISNNTIKNVHQGITIDPEGTSYGIDVVVSGNEIDGLERMGIEIQGGSTNLQVINNKVGGFGSNGNQGIALSLVTRGTGTVVTGNVLTKGGNVGLEILGNNVKVSGNTISNYRNGISVSCTPGGNYSGNTFSNLGDYGAFGRDGGYCGGETIGTNSVDGKDQTSSL